MRKYISYIASITLSAALFFPYSQKEYRPINDIRTIKHLSSEEHLRQIWKSIPKGTSSIEFLRPKSLESNYEYPECEKPIRTVPGDKELRRSREGILI